MEALVAAVEQSYIWRAHHYLASYRHGGHVQPAADDPWITGKRTLWESNEQITRSVRLGVA
jgi:hypothetical protein